MPSAIALLGFQLFAFGHATPSGFVLGCGHFA